MSLLCTSRIHHDESGQGFYRRIAQSNYFVSASEMMAANGLSGGLKTLFSSPENTSAVLGLDASCTKAAAACFGESTRFGSFLRRSHDAVCPACLDSSPYLRKFWDHGLVTACTVHKCKLIDSCPQCQSPLYKTRQQIGACDCGFVLGKSKKQEASKTQLWVSQLIADGTTKIPGLLPVKKSVDTDRAAKLIRVLATGADTSLPFNLSSTARGFTAIAQADEFINKLEPVMENWPEGFNRHIEDRIRIGPTDARTINKLLGSWFQTLQKLSQDSDLELLVKQTVAVVSQNTTCVTVLAGKLAAESSGLMTTSIAAKRLGVSVDCLLKAIRDGKCEATGKKFGTKGLVYELQADEVSRILGLRAQWISMPNAREVTGLPEAVLKNLLDSGVVGFDANWKHDFFKGGPVHKPSLEALREKLCQNHSDAEIGDDETIALSALSSRRMGDKSAIQNVFKALDKGELRICKANPILGAMKLLAREVHPIFGTPLLESGMTVEQLAKETGWKSESISAWVSAGHLGAETISRRGQACRVILPLHILEFRTKFVVLADFAKSIDMKSSSYKKLIAHAISTVDVKDSQGVTRGLLIRTGDIAQFLIDACRPGRNQRELFDTVVDESAFKTEVCQLSSEH